MSLSTEVNLMKLASLCYIEPVTVMYDKVEGKLKIVWRNFSEYGEDVEDAVKKLINAVECMHG